MKFMQTIMGLCLLCFVLSGCAKSNNKYNNKTSNEIIVIQQLKERVVNIYKNYLLIYDEKKAREETVKWILRHEEVKKAGISKNERTIWIILKNGIEIDIDLK